MIILFHALFLVTRYFVRTVSKSILNGDFKIFISPVGGDNVIRKLADISCDSYFDDTGSPIFRPPVYVQRYLAVKSVLEDDRWSGKIRKVVDFGCAEFGLFPYLKHVPGLEQILSVDVDEEILDQYRCRAAPLHSDYLKPRSEPLDVQVLLGSIADTDSCLLGCDAVICVELIEHLYPDVLECVPYTVFGYIRPLLAVFTTPNSEFNVIFPGNSGFRHPDHKFEWDREQFSCWANNIVMRYPDYQVSFQDIGPGPTGTESVGSCSQMALFVSKTKLLRYEYLHRLEWDRDSVKKSQEIVPYQRYKLLHQYTYQYCMDTRSDEMKIQDQAGYYIRSLSTCERYMRDDHVEIPLAVLLPTVETWTKSVAMLRKILEDAGWKISAEDPENVVVVYSCYGSSGSSSQQSDPADVWEFYKEYEQNPMLVDEKWDLEHTTDWDAIVALQDWNDHLLEAADQLVLSKDESVSSSDQKKSTDNSVHVEKEKENVQLQDGETQTVSDDLCAENHNSFDLSADPTVSNMTDAIESFDLSTESLSRSLCLFMPGEATTDTITQIPTDSPMIDSVSLDEPNDKLADSGYPNSASVVDMDMDLTPEQVEEIFSENGVLSDKSEDTDSVSVSSRDSVDNDGLNYRNIYVPLVNDVLFDALNVENGDVANNNRDGEGNNAVALLNPLADNMPMIDENLIPLLEAAEDIDNDNDVRMPEHIEPFPHWLLNLLGIANHGAGDALNFVADEQPLPPVADEGIGDEFVPNSSNTDTAASERGSDEGLESDNDVEGLPVDPAQEVVFPGDMGAGGEPNIFRGGAAA